MPLAEAWSAGSKKGSGGPSLPRLPQSKRLVAVVAGALALVLVVVGAFHFIGHGKGKAPSQKIALALTFTNGQSVSYNFTMSVAGRATAKGIAAPVTGQLTGTSSWHVNSVDKKGVATITVKTGHVARVTNGRQSSQPPQSFHLRVAADGHVLAQVGFGTTSGKTDSGPGIPGSDQVTPILPTGPVAVGEQWTVTFDQTNPMGTGMIRYTTASKLLRFEEVGGVNTAVIWTTADLPIDVSLSTRKALAATGLPAKGLPKGTDPTYWMKGRMVFSQTAWLDIQGRSLVKSNTSGSFDFTVRATHIDPADQPPGGKLQIQGTIKLEFVRT